MNFIFISPCYPNSYWQFCAGLKANGVRVLGIADAPYNELDQRLKDSLTEYYKVSSLENYDEVYRAVAFFAFKYGRIDWLESNNEYWLEKDARLRTDFNIRTGISDTDVLNIKEKSRMKRIYDNAGIPSARQISASFGFDSAQFFANHVGYPLIAKPDIGVGAGGTHKIHNEDELKAFFAQPHDDYVIEQFVTGDICSYDAIINSKGEPLFESMTVWPPSIMDIVNKQLDLAYYVDKDIPDELVEIGRKTVKAFATYRRFVHLEFFRLDRRYPALGDKGDFVALEVNMRPAGDPTPDMMNFAHSTDVFKIYADMVRFDNAHTFAGNKYLCAYASRRDIYSYRVSAEKILRDYASAIVMHGRKPDILSAAMGNEYFIAKFDEIEEVQHFIATVHQKID